MFLKKTRNSPASVNMYKSFQWPPEVSSLCLSNQIPHLVDGGRGLLARQRDALRVSGEHTLRVVHGLDLLQLGVVLAIQALAPLVNGESRVAVVDEATQGHALGGELVLEGLEAVLHVAQAVGGELGQAGGETALPADEPQAVGVGEGGVIVLQSLCGLAAPEVNEAELCEVGAVEGHSGEVVEGGGGGLCEGLVLAEDEGLEVEVARGEGVDGGVDGGSGNVLDGPEVLDGAGELSAVRELGHEGLKELVKVLGVAPVEAGAGVGRGSQGPAHGELVGPLAGEVVLLDGEEGVDAGGERAVSESDGVVDSLLVRGLPGLGGEAQDDTIRAAGALQGPEELGVLGAGGFDNGAVVEHVGGALKIVHGGSEHAGQGAEAASDGRADQADHVGADVREPGAVLLPELADDGAHEGTAAVGKQTGGLIILGLLEVSHIDGESGVGQTVRAVAVAAITSRDENLCLPGTGESGGDLIGGARPGDAGRSGGDAALPWEDVGRERGVSLGE
ncbi:hypothetical protein CaCOL14_004424 [Colletotrichum acutatum]